MVRGVGKYLGKAKGEDRELTREWKVGICMRMCVACKTYQRDKRDVSVRSHRDKGATRLDWMARAEMIGRKKH